MADWIELVAGTGSGFAILITVLVSFFLYPDKFEHWMAIFYRALYGASSSVQSIRRKVDRRAVASSIQDSVNGVCEQINRQAPDILPHALKIEWVQSESPESFVQKGRLVIRLKHYANQDRNIVDSTLCYLKTGLLPRSRHYLDQTLRKSCEYRVATQVFLARRDTRAYDYFMETELYPAINTDANIKRDLQMLEDLDSVGFFTRVFLTEVKQTGERLLGTVPTPAVQQELRDLAVFLQTIANKGWNEDVPLSFKGVKAKVAVVLVAKRGTIQSCGIAPYVNRVSRQVREGYESIYIAGWGEEFTSAIVAIKNELDGQVVTVLRRYDYQVRARIKGLLLVCQPNLGHIAESRELQEEVKQAIADTVPEIKDGMIEIVSIARIRGVGCKIAVCETSAGDGFRAVGACIGENGERLAEMRKRLANEYPR